MLWWIIPIIIAGVLAGAIIVRCYLINKAKLMEIARQNKSREAIKFIIKKKLKEGDYNKVIIGLRNKEGQETQEIEVHGEEMTNDFSQGETIIIS